MLLFSKIYYDVLYNYVTSNLFQWIILFSVSIYQNHNAENIYIISNILTFGPNTNAKLTETVS